MSVVSSNILAGASGNQGSSSYEIKKGLRFNSGDSAYMSRTPGTEGNRRTWTWSGWVKRSGNNRTVIFAGGATTSDTGFASIEIETDGTLRVIGWSTIWCKSLPVYRDYSAWYHIVVAFDTTQANASDQIKVYVNGEQIAKATETAIAQNTECGINQTALHAIGGITAGTLNTSFTNFYASDVHFIDGSALSPTVFGEYDSNGVWQPKKVTEADLITAKESQQPYNTRHNMAQEWSNGTETGWYIGVEKVFNHNYGDAGVPNTNANAEFTFGTAFTSTKIEALVAYGNNSGVEYGVMVDGTWHNVYASQIPNSSQQWVTLYEGSEGSVTKIRAQCGASGGGSLVAIKSNNRELVDGPADNTRIWSNNVSPLSQIYIGTPEMAFNGSLSTSAGGGFAFQANQEITLLTGESISASTLKVHANVSSSATFRVNGSTVTDDADGSSKWITLSGWSSPITSLSIEDAYQSTCRGVEIDGKILVDSPSQWNCSETWSGGLSTSNIQAGTTKYLFNGNISANGWADHTYAYAATQGTAASITGITTPTGSIRIRGYKNNAGSQFTINGGNTYSFSATNTTEWISITETSITSITFNTTGTTYLSGIEVGGKLLVDGGWGTNGFHLAFDDGTDIGKDTAETEPTLDPRGGFDAVTYTGSGTYNQISDLRFAPDLVWIKDRSAGNHHYLVDSVRGVGTSEALFPDRDVAAGDGTQRVSSLNSDGFSVFGTYGYTNTNGSNYAAWCWKAGGVSGTWVKDGTSYATAAAAGLTGITSPASLVSASINTTYGFSVIRWNRGANYPTWSTGVIPHGLTQTPKMIITKNLGAGHGWMVFHASKGVGRLYLNDQSTGDSSGYSTLPTSSVFTVDSTSDLDSSDDNISYCWSEVSGYSKFGSYTGTGGEGNTVSVGFKPAFLLIKANIAGEDWTMHDNNRGSENIFFANTSDAELSNSAYNVEFTSTGFQIKNTNPRFNTSGSTYYYAAFADYPANNFTPHNIITEENTSAKNNFGTVLYTGTGSNQAITGLNFQPDLVWVKRRNSTSDHQLYDSVRGVFKGLSSDQHIAEWEYSTGLSSFDSDGFSVGSLGGLNGSGDSHVAWAWKAGGTASSNTNGTITSSVSANPNFGFSIVSYTSDSSAAKTVGHGLSSAPRMIFFKDRDSTTNWFVYHNDGSRSSYENRMFEGLNTTAADSGSIANMNNTAPSSTVFSLGSGGYSINPSGNKNMIAYCWSEVPGYSRFSSYIGNGSTTGPVIECGFKPAFILIKGASGTTDWLIWDSARDLGYGALAANLSQGESWFGLTNTISVTDTGFQITTTNAVYNTSGATYIYAAFADPAIGDLDLVNDTPTANAADPVKGNYATLNTLDKGSNSTLSNGNLYVVKSGTTWASCGVRGTIGVTSGKYYWEITKNNDAQYSMFGVAEDTASFSDTYAAPVNAIWGYISNSGNKFNGSDGGSGASYGASFYAGDVIGVALDMDAGTLVFYKNGVSQGTAYTNLSGKTIFPWVQLYTDTDSAIFNFGQQPFKYTPPAGYKELCTTNLPDPTIEDGSKHFDVKLWDGNNADPRSITTSIGPDLVWIKTRNQTNWHSLTDSVRGAPNKLYANSTNAEDTAPIYGQIDSFSSDGFTLGGGTDATNPLSDSNQSGTSYVAWAWDAGSSNTSITAGSLNSSLYNQNSTWSSNWTASGNGFGGQPPSNGFDADFNNWINNAAGGQYITWDTTSYTLSGTLEINCSSSSGVYDVYVNGTKVADTPSSRGWVNCGSFADINEIQFGGSSHNSSTGLGSAGILIYEFKVAGKTLVDSGVSITTPSIASTVRANPSAGFSIVTYAGSGANSTISHGLNAIPEFIITKNRDSGSFDWGVYHVGVGNTKYLQLNTTAVATTQATWQDTTPTSNVFYVGNYNSANQSADDYVAYCFAPVAGYSKFGSYTGNASTDGPFVYTGFRPAFLLIKNSSLAGSNWIIVDTARDTYNESDNLLKPNSSNAEQITTANEIDILSNGFKARGTDGDTNGNGNTLIYVAFAENPFKSSRAR